jgi:hypothetical protein
MMKKEFEQRVGLVITSDEYAEIEQAYMGLPETVDKDKFCKIWLREGGIQDLFDKRLLKINSLKEEAKWNYEEGMMWCTEHNKVASERNAYKAEVETLKAKLAAIGAVVANVAA